MNKINVLLTLFISFLFCKALAQETVENPSILPPSPNSAELGRYGDIPISHSTGALNLDIPLSSITTKNLNLPISVSYSSNGLRVNAIGSRAGFDWVLNAGGVITRVVYDEPDFHPGTQWVSGSPDFSVEDQTLLDFLEQSASGGWDNQPDIFHYNFAGIAGKFVFDDQGNPMAIPHGNIKIEYVGGAPENGFLLTTADGVKYHFGGQTATELTNYNTESNCTVYEGAELPIATSWYLKRMEHPHGDFIDFFYTPAYAEYRSGVTQTYYYIPPSTRAGNIPSPHGSIRCPLYEDQTCSNYIDANVVILRSIVTSSNDSVIFDYKTRTDINGDVLIDEIKFVNRDNQLMNRYKFLHSIAQSSEYSTDPTERIRYFLIGIQEFGQQSEKPKEHKFHYKDLDQLPKRFSLSQDRHGYYNGKSNSYLVPRPTSLMDQEKFYKNGGYIGSDKSPDSNFSSKGMLIMVEYPTKGYNKIYYGGNDTYVTEQVQGNPEILTLNVQGDDDEPSVAQELPPFTATDQPYIERAIHAEFINSTGVIDEDPHIRMNVILIQNSTGQVIVDESVGLGEVKDFGVALQAGSSYTFRLEFYGFTGHVGFANIKVYPEPVQMTHNKPVSGLRVEKIESYDANENPIGLKKYTYAYINDLEKSSGFIVSEPDIPVTILHSAIAHSPQHPVTNPSYLTLETIDCDYLILQEVSGGSNSRFFSSSHIFYESVIETNDIDMLEGGVEYIYSLKKDVANVTLFGDHQVNSPFTNKGYSNGQLKQENVFIKEGGLVYYKRKTEHFYKEDPRILNQINGLAIRRKFRKTGGGFVMTGAAIQTLLKAFDVASYFTYSYWNYREKTVETIFDQDQQVSMVITTNYTFDNPSHLLPTMISKVDSRGNAVFNQKKYVQDMAFVGSEESARSGLISNYQIGTLVEEINNINGTVNKTHFTFNESATGKFTLYTTGTNTGPVGEMETRMKYVSYDARGNVREVSKSNDHTTTYLWGYNYTYPIAEIRNTTYQGVLSVLGQTSIDELNNNPGTDSQVRQTIQLLREDPAMKEAIITSYTYTPMVGMTSMTDTNNVTTYYEYGPFGRLKLVRDKDGNVLQTYEYNYKESNQQGN